jgi:NAD+ diphosphatase
MAKIEFSGRGAGPGSEGDEGYWFVFRGDQLLVSVGTAARCGIPLLTELGMKPVNRHYLGRFENRHCYAAEAPEGAEPSGNLEFHTLLDLFYRLDEGWFTMAGTAFQIVHFDRTHRYCGRCGCPTQASEKERARVCPGCGLIGYPRISPSMIVAVIRDDKILLARSPRFKGGFFSVLAGFVEPGETLEECVKREVREEVGIGVGNIRYFGSQPWPFPHSLMVGFIADHEAGEIVADPDEIVDAGWFSAERLPEIPGKISIARRLIDWFVESRRSQGGADGMVDHA